MALARSASAGGGLSINTGTANSLFGSNTTSQAPATGGLFGSATPKPATGGLFGNPTTTAPQTGGLFGSAAATPATSQPAASGGLFGASTTATSQPAQSGGLFGASMASSQPQQSGGLFGAAPATSAATAQPAQSGGLFGAAKPAATGGLFGSSTAQPAQQTGGLFGNTNTTQQQQPAATGGLFGQSQAKPATSLFGTSTAQPQQQPSQSTFGNTVGGLTMGQSTAQSTVPGVKLDISQLRTTTRFTDLHADLQSQIETIDRNILAIMHQKDDIDAIMPKHGAELNNVPYDVDYCLRKLTQAQNGLEEDAEAIAYVKELNVKDAEHAKLSFRAVDNLKLPAQYHTQGIWSTSPTTSSSNSSDPSNPSDLVSYFSTQADEMAKTLEKYQKNVQEIEQHLRGVEASAISQVQRLGGSGGRQQQMLELVNVLRDFENAIMGVAEEVGSVREGVTTLQRGGADVGGGFGRRSGVY